MSSVASSEDASRSSFSTGTGGGSVVSDTSNAGALAAMGDREDDDNVQDLLDQNKGLWDAAFACLLLLTKRRSVTSYRMLLARMVFEYLQVFRLVFNTRFLWSINTELWIWKAMYWVLFRFLIWDQGHGTYVKGLYGVCAIVLLLVGLTILIAVVLRKDDSTNWWFAKLIHLVQSSSVLVFSVAWVAVLDYMVFMFTCEWGGSNMHLKWTSVQCTSMPHLGSMIFAGVTAIIFATFVLCLAMAECKGDMLSSNLMAAPVVMTALKTTALKLVMILVSTCLDEFPRPQAVLMFLCPLLSTYFQLSSSPYLLPWMNHIWTGLWASIAYTTSLLLALNYSSAADAHGTLPLELRKRMTMAVLWGIFPAVLVGIALSWLVSRWRTRPLEAFRKAQADIEAGRICLDSAEKLRAVYRPHSVEQVEFLVRCVRQFDPVTEEVLPKAVALASLVIQVGLAKFPDNAAMLLLHSNFIIFVKKELRTARTQLQLAAKHEPGAIERFMIFAAQDVLKLSHSSADSGLDLMAFVEFQRNYRACIKSHKLALMAQRAFWRAVMNDKLHMADLLASLRNMQAAEAKAIYVYKRVLERYPQNGKLLKVWGRFQEWVLHDPARAARTYAEAVRRGLGDNLLNLSSAGSGEGADGEDFTIPQAARIDEKSDGVLIIDARGVILLANKLVCKMFAYAIGELEGKNVSILMPQPFSGRHNRYLSNYVSTGVAKILDSDKHVVAMRKDHTIFPLNLYVRKLSGSGTDAIFIGAIRPAREDDTSVARVWTTPQGVVLCSDARFCDWFGLSPEHISGRPFSSLSAEPEAVDKFLADCIAKAAKGDSSELCFNAHLHHKYLQTMEVVMTVTFGGTDTERITVVSMRSLTETQRLVVVNSDSRVMYATGSFAQMLGVHASSLFKASIASLIPAPMGHLHKPWIKETVPGGHIPAGSCRSSGAVVQLLAGNGQKIPARLSVQTVLNKHSEKVDHLHIAKFTRATPEELADARRMRLIVDARGVVVEVPGSHPRNMFGFDSAKLLGRPLASFINLFEEFRVQQAQGQQQGGLAGAGDTSRGGGGGAISRVALQLRLDAAGDGVDLAPAMLGSGSGSGGREADASQLDDSVLLGLLIQAAQEGSTANYRVGVLAAPLQDEQIGKARSDPGSGAGNTSSAAQLTGASFAGLLGDSIPCGGSSLLAARGSRAASLTRPAILKVDIMDDEDGSGSAEGAGGPGDLRVLVELWRADLLSGVLEVDSELKVVKADAAAGQLLGCPATMLHAKQLKRVLALPKHILTAADTLASGATGKTSALKKRSVATISPVIQATGVHADALPVELLLQAVPKESHSASRVLLHVKCSSKLCSTGSLQAMLHLLGAANTSAAGGLPSLAGGKLLADLGHTALGSKSGKSPALLADAAAGAGLKSGAGLLRESLEEARQDEEQLLAAAGPGRRTTGGAAFSKGKGAKSGRGSNLEQAVLPWQDDERAGGSDDEPAAAGRGRGSRAGAAGRRAAAGDGDGGAGARRRQQRAEDREPSGSGAFVKGGAAPGFDGDEDEVDEQDGRDDGSAGAGRQDMPLQGGDGRRGGDGGGEGAGGSEQGSEDEADRRMASSEAGDGEAGAEEEELTCDWRRAKRLRNLIRQLDSPLAHKSLTRFWSSSWLLAGTIMLAHIVCFAVLVLAVNTRHRDVYGVQQMTYAVDKSQMILLRSNMLSKCGFPDFKDFAICTKEQTDMYLDKQLANTADLQFYHKGLYLGFQTLERIQDPKLYDFWTLPVHDEVVYFDSVPPSVRHQNISLWDLGNRYIYDARESAHAYSAGLRGPALETSRFWQFIDVNGRDALFHGYSVSLDIYARFVLSELGTLGSLLTALLVVEIVAIGLVVMGLQMSVIRQVARQRMASFTVFLALPTATLRAMAILPCQVDEDDAHDDEDDELIEAAAAVGGGASTADAAAPSTAGDGARKSVRMSVAGDGNNDAKDGGKSGAKLAKKNAGKGKGRQEEELQGASGWLQAKAKAVKHVLRGIMNRPLRVNGKRLAPARGVFARFMTPLLLWWVLSFVIYAVSFKELADLQGPLTSLQAAAKVQYLIARTRVLANMAGFLPGQPSPDRVELNALMAANLATLKSTYFTLLYGGFVDSLEPGLAELEAPAALFHSSKTSDMFFKSNVCLRKSKPCVGKGSPWYDVTHSGLDNLMQRFLSDMDEFANLPPSSQSVNASCYEFTWRIAANDLYEGLQTAGDMFVQTTLTALSRLSQLHAILLALTVAMMAVQVLLLLVPFRRQLLQEGLRLAGLLSLLPQEADVEGHVRSLVLDVARGKPHGDGTKGWGFARGVTVAAAAARAAAARASGAVTNMRSRMAETSAANAAAAAAAGGGWQQYEDQPESEASSAQDW